MSQSSCADVVLLRGLEMLDRIGKMGMVSKLLDWTTKERANRNSCKW